MTAPHTDIVRGRQAAATLQVARVLRSLCLILEEQERGSITLAELREMADVSYERVGPIEERR